MASARPHLPATLVCAVGLYIPDPACGVCASVLPHILASIVWVGRSQTQLHVRTG